MLHSLILNLLPTSPIPPGYLTGKHLHALFLTLVSSVDRELGDRRFLLHFLNQISNSGLAGTRYERT